MPDAPAPDGRITLRFAGQPFPAWPGQTVAAALVEAGHRSLSRSAAGGARGLFCGMGICHDCLVRIDGRAGLRACMTAAADGQVIEPMPPRPDAAEAADLAPVPTAPLPVQAVDALILGAGPAGLAAARAVLRAGGTAMLVDEFTSPGGQFYKQAATSPANRLYAADRQMREGRDLIAEVERAGVGLHLGTLVWGAERGAEGRLRIGLHGPDGAGYVVPRTLVIASGGYERPEPVPGWTLPGVMTTGAAQTLLRKSGSLPGRRIFVSGNGPLNLQVAAELQAAGATIAAIADSAADPATRPAAALALLAADPALAAKGMGLVSRLRRAGTQILWSRRTAQIAKGAAGLTVMLDDGSEYAADCVLLGGNFASSNELALLLGCTTGSDGLVVAPDGATSQPDIFVAGEAARFAGAHVALAAGAETGRTIARVLSLPGAGNLADKSARAARHRRFQQALWQLYAPARPADPPPDETLFCRCESVTAGALRALTARGVDDLPTLKRLTRAGMGRCQSRYCQPVLTALLGGAEHVTPLAPQMPLRPVPLAALAVEKPEWGGHRRALLPDLPTTANPAPLPFAEIDTLVIGGGIAGLSTAMYLAREGHPVAVLERAMPNALASGGNAGSLHAQLLSFDHGGKAEGDGSAAAQTLPLQRDAIALWQGLQTELGADLEAKITGGLMVAETPAHLATMEVKTALERRMGIDARVIGAEELRALEPNLASHFIGAAYCPQEGKINPLLATQAILGEAEARGAQILTHTEVTALARDGAGYIVTTNRGPIRARAVVNAAGAFASRIGRMLGLDVPVHGAPLQMVVTEPAMPLVTHLLAHADRHLTLKQAANGNILIGGGWTANLDPVHQHPRPLLDSIEGNLWIAQHVVPALRRLRVIRTWAAMNINIDGAPILGEHPESPGLFTAVTSNGYTLGPMVGQITASLVLGRRTAGLDAFSISRFGRGSP